jgi:hypothetical protein
LAFPEPCNLSESSSNVHDKGCERVASVDILWAVEERRVVIVVAKVGDRVEKAVVVKAMQRAKIENITTKRARPYRFILCIMVPSSCEREALQFPCVMVGVRW